MGHVIHISFDLPWGDFRLVGKCHTTKPNPVVTLLIAMMGSADYLSILFGIIIIIFFFLSCLGEASTGQALDGKWSHTDIIRKPQ